jgi:hypothetical protein
MLVAVVTGSFVTIHKECVGINIQNHVYTMYVMCWQDSAGNAVIHGLHAHFWPDLFASKKQQQ